MTRQLRIAYPGAVYHVYSRGNQKQAIFFSDDDRYYFLKVLKDAHEKYGALWYLYCLMDSHYHMTLETPKPNLSQIMHFVNSAYSIYLNTKYERCGHLFQGRFKAILVQADLYARTLACYIHANPVQEDMVERPEDYEWSSCQDYFGLRKTPFWLCTKPIMACFGGSVEALKREHEIYLFSPNDSGFDKDLKKSSKIGILGDDDFVDRIRRSFLKESLDMNDPELNELRRLRIRPELGLIEEEVLRELGGSNRLARKCMIFLAYKYSDYKLKEIGGFLEIGPAAVSMAFRKIDKEIRSNEVVRLAVDRIRARLLTGGRNPKKN